MLRVRFRTEDREGTSEARIGVRQATGLLVGLHVRRRWRARLTAAEHVAISGTRPGRGALTRSVGVLGSPYGYVHLFRLSRAEPCCTCAAALGASWAAPYHVDGVDNKKLLSRWPEATGGAARRETRVRRGTPERMQPPFSSSSARAEARPRPASPVASRGFAAEPASSRRPLGARGR